MNFPTDSKLADLPPALANACHRLIDVHAKRPVLWWRDGNRLQQLNLSEGVLDMLVDYTLEDKAAKGLRAFKEDTTEPETPVHFTALEVASFDARMLLVGESGSGKTTFALHLALQLAGQILGHTSLGVAAFKRSVIRNALGQLEPQSWQGETPVPVYLQACADASLKQLLQQEHPDMLQTLAQHPHWPVLIILDGLDVLGDAVSEQLQQAEDLLSDWPQVRWLVLGRSEESSAWSLPPGMHQYRLSKLWPAQGVEWLNRYPEQVSDAHLQKLAQVPYLTRVGEWSLAVQTLFSGDQHPAHANDVLECWLRMVFGSAWTSQRAAIQAAAFRAWSGEALHWPDVVERALDHHPAAAVLSQRFVSCELTAQHLCGLPSQQWVALFHADEARWRLPVKKCLQAAAQQGHFEVSVWMGLMTATHPHMPDAALKGAVCVAEVLSELQLPTQQDSIRAACTQGLLQLITEGRLSASVRRQAAVMLSTWGDPRDFEKMVEVPEGHFTMGSAQHPNSNPPHPLLVKGFLMACYPVINRAYLQFVEETGRLWRSTEGRTPERATSPAVDLTWHDANAYCEWLTQRWHVQGCITVNQCVRLPTEPEWEYAARGVQPDAGIRIVYPWGGAWTEDHANSEETGFNDTCPVGLFPKGQSVWGCQDMTGQVWEWTSTVWGEDMATPTWRYPYAEDGREQLTAAANLRRVLRGGCFSSHKEKACCTYRGSLEPSGFWRGNGFRVVVSQI